MALISRNPFLLQAERQQSRAAVLPPLHVTAFWPQTRSVIGLHIQLSVLVITQSLPSLSLIIVFIFHFEVQKRKRTKRNLPLRSNMLGYKLKKYIHQSNENLEEKPNDVSSSTRGHVTVRAGIHQTMAATQGISSHHKMVRESPYKGNGLNRRW